MTREPLPKNSRTFFPALHGLRGIAVLYVVLSHLGDFNLFLFPIPHNAMGKVGVWIFFALSAFLLTTHLYQDIESASSKFLPILQYTVSRIFRIYPLFLIVLVFHVIGGHISALGFLKHALLTRGWGDLWAIPVEFQYYFLMPVIVIGALNLSKKSAGLLLTAALAAVLLYGAAHPDQVFSNELNIVPKLAPFLLGSMLSLLFYRDFSLESRSRFAFLIPIISVAALIINTILFRMIKYGDLPEFYAPWLSIAIGMSVSGVIYSTLLFPAFGDYLAVKPLIYLGEISFSMYLLHMFVVGNVIKISSLSGGVRAWISLGLIIICSSISYYAIEKPGIRMGKMVFQYLQKTKFARRMNSAINDNKRA